MTLLENARIYGVVDTDNYAGDYPNEKWVVQPWLRKETADKIARLLNKESGEHSSRFYKTEMQDYKLAPGFEP